MLSAIVIAKNEERLIERAVTSLRFADEIVVVDAESSDQTAQIAKGLGARVVTRAWTGFADQKNFAMEQARGPWIFALDADEAASPELGIMARKIVESYKAGNPVCYRVRREEYFLGRHLTGGPGNPSFQERLFLKEWVYYQGHVHEFPLIRSNAPGGYGLIQEPIHHNPTFNTDRFLGKMNHYTTLEAKDRFSRGQRTSLFHAVGTFFTTFFKNYVSYRGYRNGWQGVILIFLESTSRSIRHFKILELQNKKETT